MVACNSMCVVITSLCTFILIIFFIKLHIYNKYVSLIDSARPRFPSSLKPDIADITNSSARLSWPKASNISAGLEGYYHYMLWLQADGEREKNVTRVEQGAGEQRMEARITGLTFNKKYSLRVEPYREHNGHLEGGASTGVVTFKTKCTGISAIFIYNYVRFNNIGRLIICNNMLINISRLIYTVYRLMLSTSTLETFCEHSNESNTDI